MASNEQHDDRALAAHDREYTTGKRSAAICRLTFFLPLYRGKDKGRGTRGEGKFERDSRTLPYLIPALDYRVALVPLPRPSPLLSIPYRFPIGRIFVRFFVDALVCRDFFRAHVDLWQRLVFEMMVVVAAAHQGGVVARPFGLAPYVGT